MSAVWVRNIETIRKTKATVRKVAEKSLENCYYNNITDINAIKGKLRDAVSHFVYEKTKRSPMILPIIMEV